MSSEQIFDLLDDWKCLPNYRAESRVDIYIALLLPVLMRIRYNQRVQVIIPELPLRIGNLDNSHSNKSYKVDFYVRLEAGTNVIVEVKTDLGSRREEQDKYLRGATQIGMNCILDGIIKIYHATSTIYKKKYDHLFKKLIEASLVQQDGDNFRVTNIHDQITAVFIQPKKLDKDDCDVIDFNELSEIALSQADPMIQRFGISLQRWING